MAQELSCSLDIPFFMLTNYLKIALRNLWRNRLYTLINGAGLALGLTCCLFVALYIYDEYRYDRFHPNANSIYRVVAKQKAPDGLFDVAVTPGPLAASLKRDFPEVLEVARLGQWGGSLKYGKQTYEVKALYFTDNGLFHLFDFPLVKGDRRTVLTRPDQVVLTETTAARYFGTNWRSNPKVLGARLRLNNERDYTVVGVAKDVPTHSHIQFDALLSFKSLESFDEWSAKWSSNSYHTYLQLREGTDAAAFDEKIKNQCIRYNPNTENTLRLQRLTDIYLRSDFAFNSDRWGPRSALFYVQLFGAVGLIVLLTACVNFINLSTARSARRAREVGVRKTVGARQRQLIFQFLGESFLMTGLSVLLALLLTTALTPLFNQLAGKNLTLDYTAPPFWLTLGGLAALVGLLAGLYPAFLLSSFQPAKVLKGTFQVRSGQLFRRALVVGQFTLSIVLVISTLFIYRQLAYLQHKNLGFDQAHLLYVRMGGNLRQKAAEFKGEILRLSSVEKAAATTATLVDVGNENNIEWEGQQPNDEFLISQLNVDPDFMSTVGMKLTGGSNFRPKAAMDTNVTYLVNETAARRMGYSAKSALGKQVKFWGARGAIVGVVRDFHFRPLNVPIAPLILRYAPDNPYFQLLIKTRPGQAQEAIVAVTALYKRYEKEAPLQYGFVDQELDAQYRREQRTGQIVLSFSSLAILISCLGLFGLAAFTAEQRTKEIGVRKVLGASVASIVALLSKDFLKLVFLAIMIASPIAWYAMHVWLQDFAYKIDLEWWVFALAGLLAVGIALLTVSFQSVKAALMNPVKSLRSE